MGVVISPDIIQASGLSEQDFMLEIAISLYDRKVLSLGKAAEIANLHRMIFQKELAKRKIPIHFTIEEVEKDLKTLEALGV
jgi:predicted HTH domain antitoxin